MSDLAHDQHCEGRRTTSPAELRSEKLRSLTVGDIVGAQLVGGNILPFLIARADESHLEARAVTSQFALRFERESGEAADGETLWRIVTMHPLPLEYHQLMLALDRRMRLGSNGETNALDEGDLRALRYLQEHWARYPS